METKNTINPLLELCSPLFHLAAPFRVNDLGVSLPDDYREKINQSMDNLEKEAFARQVPLYDVQHIKYAMAAFIDEMVLNSAWPKRSNWMGKPLQLQYFGEHLAGEGFFKRLEELRQSGVQATNVLEVFYVCLQLGFEGMYKMHGIEKLRALEVDLRNQIETVRGTIDPTLATKGLPQHNMVSRMGRRLPFWVVLSVTVAIIFFIYLGFTVAIDKQAHNALHNINVSKVALVKGDSDD